MSYGLCDIKLNDNRHTATRRVDAIMKFHVDHSAVTHLIDVSRVNLN